MIQLKHLDEFKKILADYHVSVESKQTLDQVTFVPLVAISSSGRNTIIRQLLKTKKYYFVVSDTTRPPRQNDGVWEQNGVEYWFREEEDMLADLRNGKFIEAALIHNQQVSGVSIRELDKARQMNCIAISDVEVQGVDNMVAASKRVIPIFVLPPSYAEWMRRWQKRGAISDKERANRINSASMELTMALSKDYYHFVVNDDLSKAALGVEHIVDGHIDPEHEAHGRHVAQEILAELKKQQD